MSRRKGNFLPYSYRGSMLAMLVICALIAGAIALTSATLLGRYRLSEEVEQNERNIAGTLLTMDRFATLNVTDISLTSEDNTLTIRSVDYPALLTSLNTEQRQQLAERKLLTLTSGLWAQPITYVRMRTGILEIAPSIRYSALTVVIPRVMIGVAVFLACMILLMVLASRRLSSPVAALTQATRRVSEGDFSIRLPEKMDGEIGELMRSFNTMTDTLDRNAMEKQRFITGISHEFRTPIASIRGYADMLALSGLNDEQRSAYSSAISEQSRRLSKLSETLLRLSMLEQSAAQTERADFDLDEQIRQVILKLAPMWEAKGLLWDMQLEHCPVNSDSSLLERVWKDLLENAIKFSPANGTVLVSLVCHPQITICIQDHGNGMTAEELLHAFDAFYQADSSRSVSGAGLGLYLAKRSLTVLGGSILLQSEPEHGCTVTVTLPSENISKEESSWNSPP